METKTEIDPQLVKQLRNFKQSVLSGAMEQKRADVKTIPLA